MKNNGVDIELGYKNNFGDLGFNASAIFTTVNNEIVKIDEEHYHSLIMVAPGSVTCT